MSERQSQQTLPREIEAPLTQEEVRLFNLGMRLILYVTCISLMSLMILYVPLSAPPPQEPEGCGMASPTVVLSSNPTSRGYEFEIGFASRSVAHECYKVAVLQDGTPIWLAGYPSWKNVTEGIIMMGPSGEYLNFTDLTGNGDLTLGDFFTLEKLQSGTEYELILLWAVNDNKITSETINVP